MSKKENKKAPSFFRKKYTKKKLEAKIYKKIFVPADKTFIQGLIVETGKKGKKQIPVYGIPADKFFNKKDFKRLKILAKQIKAQKGRFKLLPFAAVLIFAAAFVCAFTLTKNLIIKKVLQSGCEKIFEARCDIGKVDFKFLDASLRINKFEIANKSEPMKDLIYIDSLALDFDLNQALRARLVSDELSVLGVETGKERSYDGSLPPKKLEKIKKEKAKKEKSASKDSQLGSAIQGKIGNIKSSSVDMVTGLFDQYNPETIIQNCYKSLETPGVSEKVQAQIPGLLGKWQNKPAELEKTVNDTQASVQNLITYDYESIASDPVKIAEAVKLFDEGIKNVQTAKNSCDSLIADMKSDSNQVTALSKELSDAVKHDTNFANSEIEKIKSFSLKDSGTSFVTGLLDNAMYQLLGSYYPYYQTISQKLMDVKTSSSKKAASEKKAKAKKAKKTGVSRAAGRNVVYRADTVPSVWIKKLSGSGKNFNLQVENICSDMNKLNKPATGLLNLSLNSISHHCDFTVDLREDSSEPLVSADYTGKNYPFNLDAAVFGGGAGSPSFDAKTQIAARVKFYEDEEFALSGNALFDKLKITTQTFEPAYASNIYSGVLSQITKMEVKADAAYTAEKGLSLSLTSDADKKFANALSAEMNKQISSVKNQAKAEIKTKLEDLSKDALEDIADFNSLQSKINSYSAQLSDVEKTLENKKKEMQNYAKNQTEKAVNDAKAKAEEEAKKQISNQAQNLLKGFF